MNLRDLSDPARLIPHLQVKVQSFTRDKRKALMVSYIDARDAAQILDDVLGPESWASTVTSPPLKVDGGWVAQIAITVGATRREDLGTGTGDLDNGAKGAVSDALKRAAVQFGVGRALYSLSPQWAPTHEWAPGKFDVQDAEKRKVLTKWHGELTNLAGAWKKGEPLPPAPPDEQARDLAGAVDTDSLALALIDTAGSAQALGAAMKKAGLSRADLADPEKLAKARTLAAKVAAEAKAPQGGGAGNGDIGTPGGPHGSPPAPSTTLGSGL